MTGWDADTYLAIDRLLFDMDAMLGRMMGWTTRPRVPIESDVALRRAWSLGLDLAQVLHEEKQRLIQAKVEFDQLGKTST
jgi:hypothetical protein